MPQVELSVNKALFTRTDKGPDSPMVLFFLFLLALGLERSDDHLPTLVHNSDSKLCFL